MSKQKETEQQREKRVAIWTDFVSLMPGLTQEHLAELKQKRGLDPEILRHAKLFSATPEATQQAVSTLRKSYSESELEQAFILQWKPPKSRNAESFYQIAPNLTDGHVVIPFMDDKDRCIYHRAHKLGPGGVAVMLFGLFASKLFSDVSRLVITEGEYKTLALLQLGIPSIAVPGISSFGDTKLNSLKLLLRRWGVRRVVWMFDNEIKDDPKLPTFKPNALKRWDTDYWACRMAQDIWDKKAARASQNDEEQEDEQQSGTAITSGVESSLIARLPDDWRIDGKIDPDAALAIGKTAQDFQDVIAKATTWNFYLKRLPMEGQIVVGYKLAKRRLSFSPLQSRNGRYTWKQGDGNSRTLSNFVFGECRRIRGTDGQLVRVIPITNEFGETAEVELDPSSFVKLDGFKQAMANAGNFRWSGHNQHLEALQDRVFAEGSPRVAEEADCFGLLDDHSWLFADGLIQADGQVAKFSKDGVAWGTSLHGYIPLQEKSTCKPTLAQLDDEAPSLLDIFLAIESSMGLSSVGLALGWTLACVWSQDIFEDVGFFPILGIIGQPESGKTTLGRWLTGGWGLPKHGQNPIKLNGSSTAGIDRTLAKYSSMPVWFDEYRNTIDQTTKESLRSVFDRSSAVKGVKSNDNKTKGSQVKGCMILSGEDSPTDLATISRIVMVRPHKEKLGSSEQYEKAQAQVALFPRFVRHCIKNRIVLRDEVLACIRASYERIIAESGDERTAWIYAIPLGAFLAFCDNVTVQGSEGHKAFLRVSQSMQEGVKTQQEAKQSADRLVLFWQGVLILMRKFQGRRSVINRIHIKRAKERILYFRFEHIFAAYREWALKAREEPPFSAKEHMNLLKESGYMMLAKRGGPETQSLKVKLESGRLKSERFCKVDMNAKGVPEVLAEIFEIIKMRDWDELNEVMNEDIYIDEESNVSFNYAGEV